MWRARSQALSSVSARIGRVDRLNSNHLDLTPNGSLRMVSNCGRTAGTGAVQLQVQFANDWLPASDVWSSDRLGRSLKHLIEVLELIRSTGTGLYIHTHAVGTNTPSGRAMLGMFVHFQRI